MTLMMGRRAATALTYGLVVGLVGVAALGAVTRVGDGVDSLFVDVASTMLDPAGEPVPPVASPSPSPSPSPTPVGLVGDLTTGSPGQWGDGSLATACWGYLNAPESGGATGAGRDGVYRVDPDGSGGTSPFNVYCEMTTDNGGWTLVDQIVSNGQSIASRTSGTLTDRTTTGGRVLPDYDWSGSPQLLCFADAYTGTANWRTLTFSGNSLNYPTSTYVGSAGSSQGIGYGIDNGNTRQGVGAWIYTGSSRIGTVWIGQGRTATCACGYVGYQSGLGTYSNSTTACSTWVR